ncbi:MAG: tRNA preQ1(34) S-adenosylmethionine ribosyltransferase-isomerase QueA [Dehalococcoidia bacterium]|nr:tRNA preQ1(34) S-adenosylmethionine ribosyltransferase-isomerase QueA [Dehalococcoidia bacterium]
MNTSDFDYPLSQELIAQTPVEPRDHSRLLVVHRATGLVEHRRFYHLVDYLQAGDVLVFNDSRVLRARLHGRRQDTGTRVELLLVRRVEAGVWECLGKPGRRLKSGVRLTIEGDGGPEAEVVEDRSDGVRLVRFADEAALERVGEVPLPPYIHESLGNPERYQTVYSRVLGSVAAPTAGLHFTPELLERCRERGVELAFVTLHIGLDTFRPVQEEDPREHKLHTEYFELGAEAAATLNRAKQEGRRIIAVGTTSVRVLEQAAQRFATAEGWRLEPSSGWVGLFILPGYRFQAVDALVTNFHLPRSTLLMLVCAFAGHDLVLRAYAEAVREGYRFYSFGDGMLIV